MEEAELISRHPSGTESVPGFKAIWTLVPPGGCALSALSHWTDVQANWTLGADDLTPPLLGLRTLKDINGHWK